MGKNAFDEYKLGRRKNLQQPSPNADVVSELFKDANLGNKGVCTFRFGDDAEVRFPSNVCSGIIDVGSFKCDPKKDDKCKF